MQSLTFITFIVSDKIAMLKLLPHMDSRPAGQPSADLYIDSHFSYESIVFNTPVFNPAATLNCRLFVEEGMKYIYQIFFFNLDLDRSDVPPLTS